MADPEDGGWTLETLRVHFCSLLEGQRQCTEQHIHALEKRLEERDQRYEQRYQAQRESVTAALAAAEKAVSKAETASEKRFESVNEFRNTLGDQQRTLMPRSESENLHHAHNDKLLALTQRLDRIEGTKTGTSHGYGIAVGVVGVLLAIIGGIAAFVALFNK